MNRVAGGCNTVLDCGACMLGAAYASPSAQVPITIKSADEHLDVARIIRPTMIREPFTMIDVDRLQTGRLLLRPVRGDDLDVIASMQTDPVVMAMYRNGRPLSRADAEAAVLTYHVRCRGHDYWAWAVMTAADGEVLGQVTAGWSDLDGQPAIELGYILKRSAWGQGYGPEAVAAVVGHGLRHLGWPTVWAGVRPENVRSARPCEKAGLIFIREEPGRHGGRRRIFTARS